MKESTWIRSVHRWQCMAFVVGVIANMVAKARGVEALWVGMTALVPLIALTLTGLWLFVEPYARSWKRSRRTAGL